MSAPECDIKKKREIRRAKVAFLYYDAIKTLENTGLIGLSCGHITPCFAARAVSVPARISVWQSCGNSRNNTPGL